MFCFSIDLNVRNELFIPVGEECAGRFLVSQSYTNVECVQCMQLSGTDHTITSASHCECCQWRTRRLESKRVIPDRSIICLIRRHIQTRHFTSCDGIYAEKLKQKWNKFAIRIHFGVDNYVDCAVSTATTKKTFWKILRASRIMFRAQTNWARRYSDALAFA